MLISTVWIFLMALCAPVSSKIVEQWPIVPDGKIQPDYVLDLKNIEINNKGWAGYHIDGSAIKPAKDVNPIISNKYVPFSYLTDNYLAYSVPFDKKISVSYPTNKMILLPDESRFPLYSFNYVTSSQLHRPVSYATKFFQIYNPTAVENKIPIDLSNPFLTQHLSSVPYSLKQNLFRPEVFFHAADVNKNLPGAIISKNENAPEFRIRLVPIPVENSISQNYPSRQTNEENDLDEQFRSGFYSNKKFLEDRNQIYFTTHNLYRNLKNGEKSPQPEDF